MKPMPDADEHRRLGDIENRIAEQLPPGARKDAHRQKARDHEIERAFERLARFEFAQAGIARAG